MSYVHLCLFQYSGVQYIFTIYVTWRVSYKRQELLALLTPTCTNLRFLWGPCCSSYWLSVLCFSCFFVLILSSSCVLCVLCCKCLWIVNS